MYRMYAIQIIPKHILFFKFIKIFETNKSVLEEILLSKKIDTISGIIIIQYLSDIKYMNGME